MRVNHYERVPSEPVRMDGAVGCRVRWLIGEADSAPNFAMRQFEVAPGGHTPRHSHPYEHEVFVLEGEGMVSEKDAEHRLRRAMWCTSSRTKSTSSATRAASR